MPAGEEQLIFPWNDLDHFARPPAFAHVSLLRNLRTRQQGQRANSPPSHLASGQPAPLWNHYRRSKRRLGAGHPGSPRVRGLRSCPETPHTAPPAPAAKPRRPLGPPRRCPSADRAPTHPRCRGRPDTETATAESPRSVDRPRRSDDPDRREHHGHRQAPRRHRAATQRSPRHFLARPIQPIRPTWRPSRLAPREIGSGLHPASSAAQQRSPIYRVASSREV